MTINVANYNLPQLVRETLRKNEKVIAVYPVKSLYIKKGILGTRWELVHGVYVITDRNIYDYWKTRDGENIIDLPIQKITSIEYFKLLDYGVVTMLKYRDFLSEVQSRYGVPELSILYKTGALHAHTSWESSLIFVNISTAENILSTIRSVLESFWPEPISITREKDEISYYMSINVPHKRVTKIEMGSGPNKPLREPSPMPEDNIATKLKILRELYEDGLITEEEYLEKKKKLLEKL